MMKITRKKIFEMAAKKIRADFNELCTIPRSGEKGESAERIVS